MDIGRGEHRIEQHQPLDCQARRHPPAVATRDFADNVIQRLVMDVVEPRTVVEAVAGDSLPAPYELVEKRVAFLAAVRRRTLLWPGGRV